MRRLRPTSLLRPNHPRFRIAHAFLPPALPHPRRLARLRSLLVAIGCVLAVASVLAGSASSAWTTNLVQLDNGTCGQNLQIGSDKTVSSSATPSFWLMGDGGLS